MARRRPAKRIARRGPIREPYDRVLIVCEGKRTEPLYFHELADRYRLSTANFKVIGSGADPKTVVREAKEKLRNENGLGENFDRVYCVFDRDEHATYEEACNEARASGLMLAISWPCFEFWLRLHFGFTRHPYLRTGGKSPAQNCVDELRGFLPGYEKAARGVFFELEDRLEEAKVHAARALEDARATNAFNPSTEVHKLVHYLQSLNSKGAAQFDRPR